MAWQFEIATGVFSHNGKQVDIAYSGNTAGLDNPADEAIPNVGPIPEGSYTIGSPHEPIDHLGPLALPLTPSPDNIMHGRFGFFIHGDLPYSGGVSTHKASDGCIIVSHITRQDIVDSGDADLVVIA